MVVLLVALLVAGFITVDWVLERRRRLRLERNGEILLDAVETAEPHWVAGFLLPRSLHYHQGHTWVHWVNPDLAYVGVDDFARRLLGKASRVRLPAIGAYVRQGEDSAEVNRNELSASILSPVSGEVVGVNRELRSDPDLMHRSPYGRGFLYKIRSPRLVNEIGNLLHGSLAERWMEDTRDRFFRQLTLATGSVIQDGGQPADDMAMHMDPEVWKSMVNEFLSCPVEEVH